MDTTQKATITAQELFAYAQNSDLVKVREDQPGLFVLKYTRHVFFEGLWNDYLVDCRGSVFDAAGNLVTLPFTKIYNDRVEAKAPVIGDDELVLYMRKVNGFMGALTWYTGGPLWSTTGSLTSPYVAMFRELTPPSVLALVEENPSKTFLFEVVHPADPHIIIEEPGLYLLGSREKELGSTLELPHGAPEGVHHVPFTVGTMGEVRELVKTVTHEGFVIYTGDGRSVKLKSPHYLTTKFLARVGAKRLTEQGIKARVEEEFYPLVDAVLALGETFAAMPEQERLDYCRNFLARGAGATS